MMKYLYLPVFILLLSCGGKQQPASSDGNNISITQNSDLPETTEDAEQLPEVIDDGCTFLNPYDEGSEIIWIKPANDETMVKKLDLVPMSKEEVNGYDTVYTKISSLLSRNTESTFSFMVKNGQWNFKKEPAIGYGEERANMRWSEYIGYYDDLKLHAVRSCAVSGDLHQFGNLFLVNAETGLTYYFVNEGDYCDGTPVLSPANKYIAILDNTWDENEGWVNYLQLIRVNEGQEPFLLSVSETVTFDFTPEKIIWLNENELMIKKAGEDEDFYYKVAI